MVDKLAAWLANREKGATILPYRQEAYVGVQAPHIPDYSSEFSAASSDPPRKRTIQQTLAPHISPSIGDAHEDMVARKQAQKFKALSKSRGSFGDMTISPDAPDINSQQMIGTGTIKNAGKKQEAFGDDVYKNETDPIQKFIKRRAFEKEEREHPTMTDEQLDQIVEQHFNQEG